MYIYSYSCRPSPALHGDSAATDTTSHHTPVKDLPNQVNQAPDNMSSISRDLQVSEEQKARMEANRLKALERAAARPLLHKQLDCSLIRVFKLYYVL
ncbi:hypothetical protein LOK49_LG11G00146 [Camellia lanceoleosa]|uniref:Uncharacterized protein n=1 Tax=Camellia lanceoleosa TaxID=1840588 RepID=A0ACC0FZ79_9ERIC|nr:hypothetical protein LOK49_LG11G00146 [Camellia lanceoleosa]